MRISDWSSDVCSSDLVVFHHLSLRRSAAGRGGGPGQRHRRPGKRHRRAVIADRAGVAPITGRLGGPPAPSVVPLQIGRASCRERVCPYVFITVVAVLFIINSAYTNTPPTPSLDSRCHTQPDQHTSQCSSSP